jgi:uncharacterized OsmC-like protein
MTTLRELQAPIKESYRNAEASSVITLSASAGGDTDDPVRCSVTVGQAIQEAQAHAGVGGPGTSACSGDLLLGALAACAQVTCQMVAASMELPVGRIEVTAEGDLDLAGTLGISREVPVGFGEIRLNFRIEGNLTGEQLSSLERKTERYCVVLQTLQNGPAIRSTFASV